MTQLYISCKESRIENNRSFYGSFVLGPFEGGQSLTIANALRRTLLSELKGLAIVSIQIEGVLHEYSSIPGVKDSVLDILLNLKEIHFTSLFKNNLAILPQVGYLRVRGPGVVRSSDLKLPPFIKLVDPDQYIATLAEDGFLNMKFIISEGKNYIIASPKTPKNQGSKTLTSTSNSELTLNTSKLKTKKNKTYSANNSLSFNLRRSLLQKIGVILDLENQKTIYGSRIYNLKKRFLKSRRGKNLKKGQLPVNLPNSNPLMIDSVFAPVTKVNYMIEYSEHKTIDTSFSNAHEINEILNFLKPLASVDKLETPSPKNSFLTEKLTNGKEALKNIGASLNTNNKVSQGYLKSRNNDPVTKGLTENSKSPDGLAKLNKVKLSQAISEEILSVKNLLTSVNISKDYVKPSTIKQNVIIEIWTNGSMHPRDALYQGLKNLVKVFYSLYKIESLDFGNNPSGFINSDTKMSSSGLNLLKQKQRFISSSTLSNLNKLSNKKPNKYNSNVMPLNKTFFITDG